MANNGKQRRRQTPESRFYDTLKGERVCIILARNGLEVRATLLWVDRYSLGLRFGDRELLLNKRSVETIERVSQQGTQPNGDDCGATV